MSRARNTGNWVDRDEPPDAKLRQVLAHFLGCPEAGDDPATEWLTMAACEVDGMVAANASEVQMASYLRALGRHRGRSPEELRSAPVVAVALWHIAKVAEVRDRRTRKPSSGVAAPANAPERLGEWLATRLLTPDELDAYQAERMRGSPPR